MLSEHILRDIRTDINFKRKKRDTEAPFLLYDVRVYAYSIAALSVGMLFSVKRTLFIIFLQSGPSTLSKFHTLQRILICRAKNGNFSSSSVETIFLSRRNFVQLFVYVC